jgi:hypothetical protein
MSWLHLVAVIARFWTPQNVLSGNVSMKFVPTFSSGYLLGIDELGRDNRSSERTDDTPPNSAIRAAPRRRRVKRC